MDLTEAQWWRLDSLLPKPRRRPNGRGRPWRDPRDVLNGILWAMRTGAPWHNLPDLRANSSGQLGQLGIGIDSERWPWAGVLGRTAHRTGIRPRQSLG